MASDGTHRPLTPRHLACSRGGSSRGACSRCWPSCCWRAARRSPTGARTTGATRSRASASWAVPPPRRARPPRSEPTAVGPGRPSGAPRAPSGCVDPDPQVVGDVSGTRSARSRCCPTGCRRSSASAPPGRVLRVRQGAAPTLVTTIPVDAERRRRPHGARAVARVRRGPARLRLRHHADRQPGGEARPRRAAEAGVRRDPARVRAQRGRARAWTSTARCSSRPATRASTPRCPARSPGRCCASTRSGGPATGNPDPRSPVLSTGVSDPGGPVRRRQPPRWPGCPTAPTTATRCTSSPPARCPCPRGGGRTGPGWRAARRTTASSRRRRPTARPPTCCARDRNGLFSGQPQTVLKGVYGRLGPGRARARTASCGSARSTRTGGKPVSSDDRVIRIQVDGGGGAGRS